jgi:hypothetical protein
MSIYDLLFEFLVALGKGTLLFIAVVLVGLVVLLLDGDL